MEFVIKRIGRTVQLNDELVKKYCEYDQLCEQPFSIAIRTTYGHNSEVSDEELSALCNEVLFTELKALNMLPKAISIVDSHLDSLTQKNSEIVEYTI